MNIDQLSFFTRKINHLLILIVFALNIGINVQADTSKIEFGRKYTDKLTVNSVPAYTNSYNFALSENGSVKIMLQSEGNSTSGWTWTLYSYSNDLSTELQQDDFYGVKKEFLINEGLPAGNYSIKISCRLSSLSCNTKDYSLTVFFKEPSELEPNEQPIDSTLINLNQEYAGILSNENDIDYYKFELPYYSNVSITLNRNNDLLSLGESYTIGTLEKLDNDNYGIPEKLGHSIYIRGTSSEKSIPHKLLAGTYFFKVNTNNRIPYISNEPYRVIVETTEIHSVGYAILFQGRDRYETLKNEYTKTLDNVQKRLKNRGFKEENIYKINQYDSAKAAITELQDAFIKIAEKLNTAPAPLYIVMIDHGGNEEFSLYPESISAEEINGWLDNLENDLEEEAKKEPRFFILGTCNSGSFIEKISKPGRIVITSAGISEDSHTSSRQLESDDIAEGELFIKILFEQLEDSKTFMDAFEIAAQEVEIFTSNKQHPLLDDNGDGVGNTMLLSIFGGDGTFVNKLKLGKDNSNLRRKSNVVMPRIKTSYLNENEYSTTLWLDADAYKTGKILIKAPNYDYEKNSERQSENTQIELDFPAIYLILNEENSHFEAYYDGFDEPGKYTIFYSVNNDMLGKTSPIYRSAVYKNKAGNNPPESFSLLLPKNDATTKTVPVFKWEPSIDPDGDLVTYNLIISSDEEFQHIVHQEEGLEYSLVNIGNNILRHQHDYYWRVDAVDSFGQKTPSKIFLFHANDTSGPDDETNVCGRLHNKNEPLSTFKDGILNIPTISADGAGRFSAKLRKNTTNIFVLLELLELNINKNNCEAKYYKNNNNNYVVYIPLILDNNKECSSVELKLVNSVNWKFEVTTPKCSF